MNELMNERIKELKIMKKNILIHSYMAFNKHEVSPKSWTGLVNVV